MKKISFFIMLSFLVAKTYSQVLAYNNNRITVSAKGNNHADSNSEAKMSHVNPVNWGKTSITDLSKCKDIIYKAIQDFDITKVEPFVIAYKDKGRNAIAVDATAYKNKYAATQKKFSGVSGIYNIALTTLTEEDGESSYKIRINNQLVAEFQNPMATVDMGEYKYIIKNIAVKNGDLIQIESNSHSNEKIPEGDSFAFSRGRWRSISFECIGKCVEEKNGLLVFEGERFNLKGDWKLGIDNEKASGGQYIYYDGPNNYTEPNHSNTISYTFKINNPGNYTVKWNIRQPEGQRGTDLGNDAWIYFSDNIGYGGDLQLEHYEKFYGRSTDNFAFNGVAEVHGLGHKWFIARFPSAGEYTLNISGRSHGLQIDRIVMFKDITMDEAQNQIKTLSETTCTDN